MHICRVNKPIIIVFNCLEMEGGWGWGLAAMAWRPLIACDSDCVLSLHWARLTQADRYSVLVDYSRNTPPFTEGCASSWSIPGRGDALRVSGRPPSITVATVNMRKINTRLWEVPGSELSAETLKKRCGICWPPPRRHPLPKPPLAEIHRPLPSAIFAEQFIFHL